MKDPRRYARQAAVPAGLLAGLLMAAPPTHAQAGPQPAFQISGGYEQQAGFFTDPDGSPTQSFDLGYTFTVTGPATVTALGFYDDGTGPGGTSLTASHAVGLFDDTTQRLLVQGTVAPTDPFDALFRYTTTLSVPDLVLLPGHTYEAVAVTGADEFDVVGPDFDVPGNPATFSQSGLVTYGEDRSFEDPATGSNDQSALTYAAFSNGNDLAETGASDFGYFGPNVELAPAPEPSAALPPLLGAAGLAGLALRVRRRRPHA